ncbi:hypothetical protein BRADI_3g14880v3 [Brachypodium distachyon]|uniref:Uncharacterized protein n=1 Tax=Brachypodium distachyon TaxID=15368 RepID=I1I0W3_BRADI|nr:hypothetical protein BRADI_3g14880v3 [Brachypodium distachyon]
MSKSIPFLAIALPLLAAAGVNGVVVHGHGGCPHGAVPSMTAQRACSAVCGTRHMRRLCLSTLLPHGHGQSAAPVTRYAAAAARAAMDAYAAAKHAMFRHGRAALPAAERKAYAGCVRGYESSRLSMGRLAGDLAALEIMEMGNSSCEDARKKEGEVRQDYRGGLRGMDACWRSVMKLGIEMGNAYSYPAAASEVWERNLGDRNRTLLAALLCSLLVA